MNLADLLVIAVVAASGAFVLLTFSVARSTRDPGIAITLLLTLYWTLVGAVPVLLAKRKDPLARYSYLEDRLFLVRLDSTYVLTLIAYSLFLIVSVVTVAATTRRRGPSAARAEMARASQLTRTLSHGRLIVICGGLLVLRLALLALVVRAGGGGSLYGETRIVRGANAKYLLAYQYLTLLGSYAGFIGAGLWLAFRDVRSGVSSAARRWITVGYVGLVLIVLAENAIVGNRAVPLIGLGAIGTIWLRYRWAPASRTARQTLFTGALILLFTGGLLLGAIGISRGASVTSASTAASSLIQTATNPVHVFEEIGASSEKLAAHMSLYGVLSNGTADTRPFTLNTYDLYTRIVNAPADQVFTHHYVTAWLLQVGPLGVVGAGVALGLVIAALHRIELGGRRRATASLALTAGSLAAVGIPVVMLRSGVESIWGIVQLMVLPAVPLYLALSGTQNRGQSDAA